MMSAQSPEPRCPVKCCGFPGQELSKQICKQSCTGWMCARTGNRSLDLQDVPSKLKDKVTLYYIRICGKKCPTNAGGGNKFDLDFTCQQTRSKLSKMPGRSGARDIS